MFRADSAAMNLGSELSALPLFCTEALYTTQSGAVGFKLISGNIGQLGGLSLFVDSEGVSISHPVLVYDPEAFPVDPVGDRPPDLILDGEDVAAGSEETAFDCTSLLTDLSSSTVDASGLEPLLSSSELEDPSLFEPSSLLPPLCEPSYVDETYQALEALVEWL